MNLGIVGYGNLGRAAEACAVKFADISVAGVFTRRDPKALKSLGAPVFGMGELSSFSEKIDVLFVAGGSANDLPAMTPELAGSFNVIDSFDNHSMMAGHFANVSERALASGHLALIGAGWDPGVFSIMRILFRSFLPDGVTNTFWGRGISQGHSNAIRRIEGVADARQYTVPRPEILGRVRDGEEKAFSSRETHIRECFVVAKPGADRELIEKRIRTMPGYFEGYETVVRFISQDELDRDHSGLPHGGSVIRNGVAADAPQNLELSLRLGSNPEFTASVILAYSRALYRLRLEGKTGCLTVADVAPKYLFEGDCGEIVSDFI